MFFLLNLLHLLTTNCRESQECIKVKNNTVIPNHHEFIAIYCKKLNGSDPVTVPVDMFNFVHLKPEVEKRVQEWQDGKELQHRRVNVVILGLDGVSHMNFKRVMPKTLKYTTEQLNAIGMDGLTKVGDNTFPNIGRLCNCIFYWVIPVSA